MIAGLHAIRGPLLNPSSTAGVDYFPDGVLVGDDRGRIVAVGAWDEVAARLNLDASAVPRSRGLILPPLLDAHIHIPQHPSVGGSPRTSALILPAAGCSPASSRMCFLRRAAARGRRMRGTWWPTSRPTHWPMACLAARPT